MLSSINPQDLRRTLRAVGCQPSSRKEPTRLSRVSHIRYCFHLVFTGIQLLLCFGKCLQCCFYISIAVCSGGYHAENNIALWNNRVSNNRAENTIVFAQIHHHRCSFFHPTL